MKTSNLLLLTAALLVIISLGYYDYMVKSAFDSGKYKDRYNGFVTLPYKGFDTVDIISSTAANVKFERGPFNVEVDSVALEYVSVKQNGRRLQISAEFKEGYLYNRNEYLIIIRCPRVSGININALYYINNGKPYIDTIMHEAWNMKQILIDGFKQDTLSVNQDYGSTLVFNHNTIKYLFLTAGKSPGSGSKTVVLEDNRFDNAKFEIGNKSGLFINSAQIGNLNYKLADSARVQFNGVAQQSFNHAKSSQKNEINH